MPLYTCPRQRENAYTRKTPGFSLSATINHSVEVRTCTRISPSLSVVQFPLSLCMSRRRHRPILKQHRIFICCRSDKSVYGPPVCVYTLYTYAAAAGIAPPGIHTVRGSQETTSTSRRANLGRVSSATIGSISSSLALF